jgi:3-methylcrotonyl-CoA carboxylase alpha subunit
VGRVYRTASDDTQFALARESGTLVLHRDSAEITIDDFEIGERYVTVTIDGHAHRFLYARESAHVHISCAGESLCLIPADEDVDNAASSGSFSPEVTAPMPGKVLEVLAKKGDRLETGAPLLLLEAMKMEQTIRTATPAEVLDIHVQVDAMVGPGETLVTLGQIEGEQE